MQRWEKVLNPESSKGKKRNTQNNYLIYFI